MSKRFLAIRKLAFVRCLFSPEPAATVAPAVAAAAAAAAAATAAAATTTTTTKTGRGVVLKKVRSVW